MVTDAVIISANPAESARRYYKRTIADRSERWNVCYKALFLLDFCHHHRLRLLDDLWITPDDLINHIERGLRSGERNSRCAGNYGAADGFAKMLLDLQAEIEREMIRHESIDGAIILDILCRIMPGARVDLARHPAELR